MKIVVASDSFKGSLSSAEAAECVAAGILGVMPDAEVVTLAVGDGGEGTAEALVTTLGGTTVECSATDPIGRTVKASYGLTGSAATLTAVMDVASACGLCLAAPHERNLMQSGTQGVGEMMLHAYARGCRRFVVGLGGSATCDGGIGMLSALGFRFLDSGGATLPPIASSLGKIAAVDALHARREILACDFAILTDVTNPLHGPEGAAHVFAPQKGASPHEVPLLDAGLERWAKVIKVATGHDVGLLPGSGAAGGLGAAFAAFFNSRMMPGVEAVLDMADFDRAIAGASLVVTGEGKIDRQTLYGKLPMGVLRRAAAKGIPVTAIAGKVDDAPALHDAGFGSILCATPAGMPLAEAMRPSTAMRNVTAAGAAIARQLLSSRGRG